MRCESGLTVVDGRWRQKLGNESVSVRPRGAKRDGRHEDSLLDRLDGRNLDRDTHSRSFQDLDGSVEVLSGEGRSESGRVLRSDDEGSTLKEREVWKRRREAISGRATHMVRRRAYLERPGTWG